MRNPLKNLLLVLSYITLACGLLLCMTNAFATVTVTAATGGDAISADTAGGAYTVLTGPAIRETDPAGFSSGTIVLNAPSGFIFDTGSNVTATVSGCGSGAGTDALLGTSPGSSMQTVIPTTTTITIDVFRASGGTKRCTLTWSNIKVRPTAGTPLASGNITRSGGAVFAESSSNYGTLTEVAGAAARLAFIQQPTNTAAGVAISPAVTVRVQDQFGNPRSSSGDTQFITVAIGTNPAGGSLSGTVTVNAVNGFAIFSNLSINNAGAGYTLTANASDLIGAVSTGFNIGGAATGFDAVEVGAAQATTIFMKLAGTAFSVDILALDSSNNIETTYSGTVNLKLVDAGTGGGVCGSMAVLQDYGSFSTFSSGRKSVTLTYANAARNAKIRINDASAGVTSCSTDNFSIRPVAFTGVTSSMTNATTSGTPSAAAGSGNFTLTAATGLAGYDGTPKIDNTAVQAHAGAIQNGAITGVFTAAVAGTATGSSFTYSEVGNFRLLGSIPSAGDTAARGLYDDTFTTVDAGDCTSDFSNTLSGGKYGCKFGITANSSYFGRFYPASFALTASAITPACSAVSGFTYMGQGFTATATIQALNAAGTPAITRNYDGAYAGGVALFAAENSNNGTDLSSRLTVPAGTWAAGVYTLNTTAAVFSRPVTATPDATWGPYDSLLAGIRIADTDGPVIGGRDMDPATSGSCASCSYKTMGSAMAMRLGRLHMHNAYGSELLNLPVALEAQYWAGTYYAMNTLDSCTTIPASSLTYSGFQPATLAACETHTVLSGALSAGRANLGLTAPGSGNSGSVNLTVNAGSTASGITCTTSTSSPATAANMSWFGTNPSAKATFGIRKTPLIYLRENF